MSRPVRAALVRAGVLGLLWLGARDSLVPPPCQGLLHPALAPADLHLPGRAAGLGRVAVMSALVGFFGGALLAVVFRASDDITRSALVIAPFVALLSAVGYTALYASYVPSPALAVMGGALAALAAAGAAVGALIGGLFVRTLREDNLAVAGPGKAAP